MALPPHQQAAITLIKTGLDCYNGKDGTGLFTGVERYARLTSRVGLCAVQAGGDVPRFWGLLLHKMQWPVPPKRADDAIVAAIGCANGGAVLKSLATETASLITLARMIHDADKQARRDYHAALRDEADLPGTSPVDHEPNDPIPSLGF